jgi:hypothetical protein
VGKWRENLLGLFGIVALLALIAVAGWGIFLACRFFWHTLIAAPREIAAAIIAASATVFASSVAVTAGQYLQRQAVIRQEIRTTNGPIYARWVDMWFHIMFAEQMGREPLTEQEVVQRMSEFSQLLTLQGSDRAVRDWVGLRLAFIKAADAEGAEAEALTRANMIRMAQFLKTLRRDMGHRNTSLDDITMLGLFVNDAQQALDESAS